jgi:hypothetical protein
LLSTHQSIAPHSPKHCSSITNLLLFKLFCESPKKWFDILSAKALLFFRDYKEKQVDAFHIIRMRQPVLVDL